MPLTLPLPSQYTGRPIFSVWGVAESARMSPWWERPRRQEIGTCVGSGCITSMGASNCACSSTQLPDGMPHRSQSDIDVSLVGTHPELHAVQYQTSVFSNYALARLHVLSMPPRANLGIVHQSWQGDSEIVLPPAFEGTV